MLHLIIYRTTFILIAFAWVLAVKWFFTSPDYEPALTAFSLLATMTGVFAERWYTTQEARKNNFNTLLHELRINVLLTLSPPFVEKEEHYSKIFYPRFYTKATDIFLSSGQFISDSDRLFLSKVYLHQQVVTGVNRKLNSIEAGLFSLNGPSKGSINEEYYKAIIDGPISELKESLTTLDSHFKNMKSKEYVASSKFNFGDEVTNET